VLSRAIPMQVRGPLLDPGVCDLVMVEVAAFDEITERADRQVFAPIDPGDRQGRRDLLPGQKSKPLMVNEQWQDGASSRT
jgi:hypothetical protein